jgi:hypothetical protein
MRNILYIFLLGLSSGCSTIPGYVEWQENKKQYLHMNNTIELSLNCTGGDRTRWYHKANEVKDCYRNGPYFQYHKKF